MVIERKSHLGTWCSESETWISKPSSWWTSHQTSLSSSHLWLETRTHVLPQRNWLILWKYVVNSRKILPPKAFYHEFYRAGITTWGDGKAHCKFIFQWPGWSGFTDILQNQHVPGCVLPCCCSLSLHGRLRHYNLSEAASFQLSVSE